MLTPRIGVLTTFLYLLTLPAMVQAQGAAFKVRVKDAVRIEGVENYTMVGYGLVVGLAGTGDSDEVLTQRTLANMLQNFNMVVDEGDLKAQNSAAVMLTATIRGSAHTGDTIQTTISSIGDATSLTGGELLLTPLLGTTGETWAIAQGAVTTGGFQFGSGGPGGQSVTKNHPTVGILTNGAKMLVDIGTSLPDHDMLTVYLKKPDYSTAVNLVDAINSRFYGTAFAADVGTIKIRVPVDYREEERITEFIRDVEQIQFQPDGIAKVVFNERTGTIVFGGDVKISQVAISHGNVTVNIKNTEGISQPSPFSDTGTTESVTDQQTQVHEENSPVNLIPAITTISELVDILNLLGVTPRDIMVIFHTLREAGALHAELEAI